MQLELKSQVFKIDQIHVGQCEQIWQHFTTLDKINGKFVTGEILNLLCNQFALLGKYWTYFEIILRYWAHFQWPNVEQTIWPSGHHGEGSTWRWSRAVK